MKIKLKMTVFTAKRTEKTKNNKNNQNSYPVVPISIFQIRPDPHKVRRYLDREALISLAKSVSQLGIIQPLLVRRDGENSFVLVSGERRLRAARLAGLKYVPCIILGISQRKAVLFSLAENLQKDGLNIFEEAQGIAGMIDFYGMTAEDAALRLGLSNEEIRDKLNLLRLSDEEKRLCQKLKLSCEQVSELSKISPRKLRLEALEKIATGQMSPENVGKIGEILAKEEKSRENIQKNKAVLGNRSLFFNTINKAVEILNGAGGNAVIENITSDNKTMLLITVDNS